MRYIRLKEGKIIDTILWVDEPFTLYRPRSREYIDKRNIVKEADTIEELFDEIVAVRKSDNTKHLGKIDYLWFIEQTGWVGRFEDYKSIYGAIWIEGKDGEPILKPVAKINEEGEPKLL